MITKSLKLYYEKDPDGFYPVTYYSNGNEEISIDFIFIDGCWQQYTEYPISEFDYTERKRVLDLLNDELHFSNIILDTLGYLI